MTATPRTLWYLTIDDRNDYDHGPNMSGLGAAVTQWGNGLTLERHWLGDLPGLTAAQLIERGVFALFLAGSFPEWYEYRDEPAWAKILDHLSVLVHTSHLPMIAICGSHQAVARSFASWAAVGHMVPAGDPPIRISQELVLPTPENLIPANRIGEVGTYPFNLLVAGDPLFAGLEGRLLHFTEAHYDEVEDDARSRRFTPLAEPARSSPAAALGPIAPADRAVVQALRYEGDGRGEERVLYTLEFHPELPAHPAFYQPENAALLAQANALGNDGNQLLLNFFDVAEAWWKGRLGERRLALGCSDGLSGGLLGGSGCRDGGLSVCRCVDVSMWKGNGSRRAGLCPCTPGGALPLHPGQEKRGLPPLLSWQSLIRALCTARDGVPGHTLHGGRVCTRESSCVRARRCTIARS
jgi:hypothetical protein